MADEDVVGMVTDVADAGSDSEFFSDQPPDEPEVPAGDEGEPAEPAEPEEPSETPEEPKKDVLPANVSRLLREIREANPDATPIAKELQSAYFSQRAYKEVFPNIEDARLLKASFEAVGGQEGLVKLQGTAEFVQDLDRMLDSGDPKLVEEILAQSPEGFQKIVPHALRTLERTNPQAYEALLRPELARGVVGSTVGMYIESAVESLKAGDTDMAMRRLSPALGWFKQLEKEVQESSSRPADPRLSDHDERSQSIDQREQEMNRKWVERDMNAYSASGIESALRPMLKGLSLSAEAKNDLTRGIIQEIGSALVRDEAFQKQMNALVRRGDTDKALQLAKAHIDRIRPEAVKSVWGRRYGSFRAPAAKNGSKPAARTERTAQASGLKVAGVVQVPKMPPIEAIDRSRTTSMMIMDHKAVLKDGRTVTWPR